MFEAKVRMQAITVVDGAARSLVVHIAIECEDCGSHDLLIAGHHVRPIVEVLQELMVAEPELTYGGAVQAVDRRRFEIHPEDN